MKYFVFPNGRKFMESEMEDIFHFYRTAFADTLTYNSFITAFEQKCNMKTVDTENLCSVVDFLNYGLTVPAVKFYRDIHKCDLRAAKDMVDKIRKDMFNFRGNKMV